MAWARVGMSVKESTISIGISLYTGLTDQNLIDYDITGWYALPNIRKLHVH